MLLPLSILMCFSMNAVHVHHRKTKGKPSLLRDDRSDYRSLQKKYGFFKRCLSWELAVSPIYLKFYWSLGWPFRVFCTIWCIYPSKGLCKANTEGGPIVFTYFLFCVRKRILDFQFTSGFLHFWDLENVLSLEGTLLFRVPKEVQ